ncbi:MAG: flavodoxin family protein [Candidatus Bipolaricaulaceae bacterium]
MRTVVLSALAAEDAAVPLRAELLRLLRSRGDHVRFVDLARLVVKPCVGCGRCGWESPGRCVLRDDMTGLLPEVARCDRLVLATPIFIGVHHPLLKRAVDRLLPLAGPLWTLRQGEMHHVPRHPDPPALVGVGWLGQDGRPEEEATFRRLIGRHAVNLGCPRHAAVVVGAGADGGPLIAAGLDLTEVSG